MKKLGIVVLVVVVVLIVLAVAKNMIARNALSAGVKRITGLELKIGGMDVGLRGTSVGMTELEVLNPPGFKDPVMAGIPELYVDYDLGAFVRGKVHLEKVRVNLHEFLVVKDEKGTLNIDSLKQSGARKKEPRGEGEAREFKIDVLELKVGRVIYKDYSRGASPSITEFDVNVNDRYENVTDARALAGLIVERALVKTAIASLAEGLVEQGLERGLGHTLKKAKDTVTGTLEKVFGGTGRKSQ